MRRTLAIATILLISGFAAAQESASYKLKEHTFNAGGHPAAGAFPTSASYRMTLDAIGDSIVGRNLSSTSYNMDGSFGAGFGPPSEVTGLVIAADDQTLSWNPERSVGRYNLYRDLLTNLSGGGYGACEQLGLGDETTTDGDRPPDANGYFYLVTAENRLSEEGTMGWDSGSSERPNTAPCP